MNEEQMRAEFEAWWANFQSEHEEWRFADRKAILFQAWLAALSAKSVPTLSDDEFSALYRCDQTMGDDNSYDIDATMMKKLADYGAVWHKGGGYYAITKFGNYLLKTKNGSITSAPQPTDDRVRSLLMRVAEKVRELEHYPRKYGPLCSYTLTRIVDEVLDEAKKEDNQ